MLFATLSWGQEVNSITDLSDPIKESSGLIYLDHKIISINDSGGEAALYEIDSLNGGIIRTVTVSNASNVDWEEICFDDTFIYICDFGNNNGSRTDLKIYRLLIDDYLNSSSNTVSADTIEFAYSDQTDFTATTYSTNFDAEAAVVMGDSIYVFTKNWGDNLSNVYSIPKIPGSYSANKIETINPEGLITGAIYNVESESIILTGYALPNFFVVELSDVTQSPNSFDQLMRYSISIPSSYSMQVEGIASIDASNYYLTSEKSILGSAGLFSLSMNASAELVSEEITPQSLFPNPFNNSLFIDLGKTFNEVEITISNAIGEIIYLKSDIMVRDLKLDIKGPSGVYFVKVNSDSIITIEKVVKN